MPKASLQKLNETVESANELTPEHREELRRVIRELKNEVDPVVESGDPAADSGELRDAIDLTGELVKRKGSEEAEDILGEFETAVEKIAINHPTIAGVLTALGKLV